MNHRWVACVPGKTLNTVRLLSPFCCCQNNNNLSTCEAEVGMQSARSPLFPSLPLCNGDSQLLMYRWRGWRGSRGGSSCSTEPMTCRILILLSADVNNLSVHHQAPRGDSLNASPSLSLSLSLVRSPSLSPGGFHSTWATLVKVWGIRFPAQNPAGHLLSWFYSSNWTVFCQTQMFESKWLLLLTGHSFFPAGFN